MGRARRRLLVLSGVVVVAAGGVAAWLVLRPAEASTQPIVAAAQVGTQRQTVAASGTVEPAEQADLNFTVSGTVTEVLVKEGDQVTAGQALASVDDTLLVAQRDAAQAALDAAEDKASGDDDAAVLSARSELTAAQDAVDDATLTSTIAGTVATVGVKVGDRLGDNAGAGNNGASNGGGSDDTAQFTIVSTHRFVVDAKVGAEDVDKVKAGMAVEIRPTGANKPVEGTVQTVGLVASADESGAATFPVTVDVTGEHDDVYAGSSADVSIVVEERQNVLTVPAMALHTSGGKTYVNKMVDGTATRTDVTVGDTFGGQTEIKSGLKEGDQVEVAPAAPTSGGGGDKGRTGMFPGGGGDEMVVPGGKGGMRPGIVSGGGK